MDSQWGSSVLEHQLSDNGAVDPAADRASHGTNRAATKEADRRTCRHSSSEPVDASMARTSDQFNLIARKLVHRSP